MLRHACTPPTYVYLASLFKAMQEHICMYANVCPLYVQYWGDISRSRRRACLVETMQGPMQNLSLWPHCTKGWFFFRHLSMRKQAFFSRVGKRKRWKRHSKDGEGRSPDKGSFSENISLAFQERRERAAKRMASQESESEWEAGSQGREHIN